MKKRYTLRCAVFLILTKIENNTEYILLQKRYHTEVLSGKYDVSCSGHLEENDSVKEAMIREAKEEININLKKEDLYFSSTMHAHFEDADYILITFWANTYQNTPKIMEPDKCNELKWFKINELPEDLADTRKIMIENYKNHIPYTEYGFESNKEIY